MSEKDLKLKASISGAEETAAKIEQISGAEEKLRKTKTAQTDATTKASDAQGQLNASESDYAGLLAMLSPQLAMMVDGMLKAAKVAGELDLAQGGAAKTMARLTAAAAKHASVLKLIGAGGAVVLAIGLITKAMAASREEFERNTKAIKDNEDAMNELHGKEADRAKEIERIADSRRGGGFNADTARSARIAADRVKQRFGDLSDAAINQATGLLGDQNMSQDQLATAAFLIQSGRLNLDANAPTATNRRIFESSSRRNAAATDTFFSRETTQRGEAMQEAGKQASATSGATDQLREVIRRTLSPGADVDEYVKLMRQFGSASGLDAGLVAATVLSTRLNNAWDAIGANLSGDTLAVPQSEMGDTFKDAVPISGLQQANLRKLYQAIDRGYTRPSIHVTNNNQNARFIGPSAAAQRRARTNGEQIAMGLER